MNLLMVIYVIPLLLNVLAIVRFRGFFRIAALLVLPFPAVASVCDLYSASQEGNLAGLFTIVVSGPSLVALLLLWLGNSVMRERRQPSGYSRQTDEPDAEPVSNAPYQKRNLMAWRAARWAISGSLFGAAAGGLIFGGPAVFVAMLFGGPMLIGTEWLRAHSVGYLAWPIGAAFGGLGGVVLALIGGRKQRSGL